MGYTPEQKELLDAMQIMIDNALKSTAKIYGCIVIDVEDNKCTIKLNNQLHTVQYYGSPPTINQQYRVFVPFGQMSQAFIISA